MTADSRHNPGRWLETELRSRNIKPRDVARTTDLSTQAVYAWFSGRSKPSEHVADQLAELLDIPALELRWRFNLDIPKWAIEEAQWRVEVERYLALTSEDND